jgi:hypothetical protein
MALDLQPVAEYIRRADTEELLDRVTIYRDDMEPAAVDLMENELWRRGLTRERVADHAADRRKGLLWDPDGRVVRCAYCDRPAVSKRWGLFRPQRRVPTALWFTPWGLLLFVFWSVPRFYPWPIARCAVHDPMAAPRTPPEA